MTAGAARGIRLPAPPRLPVIGAVAAGSPLLAVENQRGTLPIGPELFSPRADYLLQVRGNSMSGVGILDGDLLAVHRTAEARSGQIVVARLEDEVTVKHGLSLWKNESRDRLGMFGWASGAGYRLK